MAIDLHIHSSASGDGELNPKELIKMAKDIGLEAISITDHDTIKAVDDSVKLGESDGVEVVPGVEITSIYGDKILHILGYYIDINNTDLLKLFEDIRIDRESGIEEQIKKVLHEGFQIDKAVLMDICKGQPPLYFNYAVTMFEDKANDNNKILEPYRNIKEGIVRFCIDYFLPGKLLHVPMIIPKTENIITYIRAAEGVPVLAHPGVSLNSTDNSLLDVLLECGLSGIEVYTSYHSEEEENKYMQYCLERNILYTCGSDFHGSMRPNNKMGINGHNSYDILYSLRKKARML
jgi:3',5'-nucleoside bisphosphate phosphatase